MNLGLVIPRSGPSGIFGPSCAANAQLAVEEINERGGILGDELSILMIDGGARVDEVATTIDGQLRAGTLDAIVGWHTSAVRRHLVDVVRGRIPYVYTAVYEGGESAPSTFMTGEVPDSQLMPALRWMADEIDVRRWVVVGSDYGWPRRTAATVADRIRRHRTPAHIITTLFRPLGTPSFDDVLDVIERCDATGVLMLLLGDDAVRFNRAFGARGLHDRCVRLSPLMDENMLLGTGDHGTRALYSVSGFFESLPTPAGLDLGRRYVQRFGVHAPPLTSPGESCYEGLTLLAELVGRAGTLNPFAVEQAAQCPFTYDSPRGTVRFASRHLRQDVYLARADGLEFDVLSQVS